MLTSISAKSNWPSYVCYKKLTIWIIQPNKDIQVVLFIWETPDPTARNPPKRRQLSVPCISKPWYFLSFIWYRFYGDKYHFMGNHNTGAIAEFVLVVIFWCKSVTRQLPEVQKRALLQIQLHYGWYQRKQKPKLYNAKKTEVLS